MKEFRTSKILLFGIFFFFFFFFLDNSKKNKVGGIRSRAKSWVALGTATRHPSSSVLLAVKILVLVLIFMAGRRMVVHARRMGTVGMKSCGYSDPHVQKLHKLWHTSLLLRERERETVCSCRMPEKLKEIWMRFEEKHICIFISFASLSFLPLSFLSLGRSFCTCLLLVST